MPDDPAEIARRARLVREAALKARAAGRLAPTIAELNEALGDEAGVSSTTRREAGKAPKRYGVKPRGVPVRDAVYHGPKARNGRKHAHIDPYDET